MRICEKAKDPSGRKKGLINLIMHIYTHKSIHKLMTENTFIYICLYIYMCVRT